MSLSLFFANKIKEYRKKANLSQRDLASLMGVPYSTIARLEIGESGINSTTIEKFCEISGMGFNFTEERKHVFDVASYILIRCKNLLSLDESKDDDHDVTNMKLNKLLYFVQLAFVGQTGEPMFEQEFKGWQHGSVHLSVYHKYKQFGNKPIPAIDKEIFNLSEKETVIINQVLKNAKYGFKSAYELRSINHDDVIDINPWQKARRKGDNEEIKLEDMINFYPKSDLSKYMSPP
jgi:uncharacterized phage-associated protein/DNA-binding XRE family transcriptional regulator